MVYQGESFESKIQTKVNGVLSDPTTVTVEVINPAGETVLDAHPALKESTGIYKYPYVFPDTAMTGMWIFRWTVVWPEHTETVEETVGVTLKPNEEMTDIIVTDYTPKAMKKGSKEWLDIKLHNNYSHPFEINEVTAKLDSTVLETKVYKNNNQDNYIGVKLDSANLEYKKYDIDLSVTVADEVFNFTVPVIINED